MMKSTSSSCQSSLDKNLQLPTPEEELQQISEKIKHLEIEKTNQDNSSGKKFPK
jgi:hypothetical protein